MSNIDTVWREVRDLGRGEIQRRLEQAGFGVYDDEPLDDLVEAWVLHCRTEGADPLGEPRCRSVGMNREAIWRARYERERLRARVAEQWGSRE